MRDAYCIEVRDINGNRTTTSFKTRDEFYYWAVAMSLAEATDDYEILEVCRIVPFRSRTLFCSLGDKALDWEDLIGFLA